MKLKELKPGMLLKRIISSIYTAYFYIQTINSNGVTGFWASHHTKSSSLYFERKRHINKECFKEYYSPCEFIYLMEPVELNLTHTSYF